MIEETPSEVERASHESTVQNLNVSEAEQSGASKKQSHEVA